MIELINKHKNERARLNTFLNPYSYILARKDKELFQHFSVLIDGIVLVKLLNFIGFNDVIRRSFDMTSLAPIVFNEAISSNSTLYFIGTSSSLINQSIRNIKKEFPDLKIIGYRDGYIDENDMKEVLNSIYDLKPDIVVCGMGTPLQERFLLDLQSVGWCGVGYTCGGFLHQAASNLQYFPKWIDKYNLRWAYRIYDEPRKVFKRVFVYYTWFLVIFTYDAVRYKLGSDKRL